MTAATDTTTEPATESAGTKLMLLLKSVVFIFLFSISVIPNQTIKKPLAGCLPVRGQTFLFQFRSTTATSRTAADNYGDGDNNNNADVVENSIHFFLVSISKHFLIYHIFLRCQERKNKKIKFSRS